MNIKAVCILVLVVLPMLAYSVIAQPMTYLIFFDYDDSDITREGVEILRQAAELVKSQPGNRVGVIGHTDIEENAAISLERARNVAAELITLGMPSDRIINVTGVGDSKPLVKTPMDPMGHAQNRRVEIKILGRGQRG